MKFEYYKDEQDEWRWRLRAANGRIIADSGESYKNRVDCLHAIELLKGVTGATVVERLTDERRADNEN